MTITDAQGGHTYDVMDGEDYVLTSQDKADIAAMVDAPVQDVQVNGTSILNNGVANVPKMSANDFGVAKVGNGLEVTPSGILRIVNAGSATIKTGTSQALAVTPLYQHESTFYGLAKAAGDATQSASSNTVGTYTDAAKIAIQKMLGIYQAPWELIREDEFTNATEADHIISVDALGQAFELTDIYLQFWLPQQETDARVGNYGRIDYYYNNSQSFVSYHGAKTQTARGNENGTFALLRRDNGGTICTYGTYNTMGTDRVAICARGRTNENKSLLVIGEFTFIEIKIGAITGTGHYKLYGRRKWN